MTSSSATNPPKTVAILQSNYIPWLGYFQLVNAVDEFIVYDQVQYTKNDWRNRNKIKSAQGAQWLSIPAGKSISRNIDEVEVRNPWRLKHWSSLEQAYRGANGFDETAEWLAPHYLGSEESNLSITNRSLLGDICAALEIPTRITSSRAYSLVGDRTERLVNLCLQSGATTYISGPAARGYLDQAKFAAQSIEVRWFDYPTEPPYRQLWGDFTPGLSAVDLLFNLGRKSAIYFRTM